MAAFSGKSASLARRPDRETTLSKCGDKAPACGTVVIGDQFGVENDVLIAPMERVQHGQNGLYVFVVDDQSHAKVRQVKVAHQDTTTAVISGGPKEGDRVVTSGQFLLQPGSIVSIDTGSGT
jgi:multidrug efflux pump subunit AcrA (membrane-fusion protein)